MHDANTLFLCKKDIKVFYSIVEVSKNPSLLLLPQFMFEG